MTPEQKSSYFDLGKCGIYTPPPPVIQIHDDQGPYVTIKPGGEVILREGLEISDAARGFWEKLAEAFPAFKAGLTAAPPAPRQHPVAVTVTVTVKPLEWEKVEDGSFCGNSPIGKYLIFPGTGFSYELWAPVGGRIGIYKRLEMAQHAAQADYERRIFSAIEPAPADELREEVERLRRLADARKAWLDATAAYNARLAVVKCERDRGNHSMRVDDEYRSMEDAQRTFWKTAQDVADATLNGKPK